MKPEELPWKLWENEENQYICWLPEKILDHGFFLNNDFFPRERARESDDFFDFIFYLIAWSF